MCIEKYYRVTKGGDKRGRMTKGDVPKLSQTRLYYIDFAKG